MSDDKWVAPFSGLVHVTGEPDTGKTTFCLTIPGVKPKDTLFFDDDLKTRGLAAQLAGTKHAFWGYHDLTTEFKELKTTKPIDFYRMLVARISTAKDQILEGTKPPLKAIVFDNWSRMEGGIRAYSESIMSNISDLTPGQQHAMSQMTWTYTYDEYARLLGELLTLAPMVFLTTHIREKWGSPGVLESRGQRPIIEKSTLRVWLRHNPDSPAPIGLILKRVHLMQPDDENDGQLQPINVFPRRIVPCTWAKLMGYFRDPVGDRKPTPDEMPNEFELSILDGTLTEDQKNALRLASKQQKDEDETLLTDNEATADAEMMARARQMKSEGKTIPDIVAAFGGAVQPGKVAQWIKGM